MGDSIGRWEGDTLVVETTNFHPLQIFRGASDNLKVTERFTRVGRRHAALQVHHRRPDDLHPAVERRSAVQAHDELIYEYACHEGNYALSNMLSGERAQEKARTGREEVAAQQ